MALDFLRSLFDLGQGVPGGFRSARKQAGEAMSVSPKEKEHQEKVERMRDIQALSRRMGALGVQEEAEKQMAAFNPAMIAMGGPASIGAARRIGGLASAAGVKGEIAGKLQAERFSPERAQEVIRNRMIAIATQMAGQGATKAQIQTALLQQAGGDPELRKEAAKMSAQGRQFAQGTIPGFAEDIGNLFIPS